MIHSQVISSDKVEGSSVYNGNGDKLGSIDDLMIDKYSGHVRYAVLEFATPYWSSAAFLEWARIATHFPGAC